jgi:formate dehydrogenase major subunit
MARQCEARRAAGEVAAAMKIQINGSSYEASAGERLVDVINRVSKGLPQVCYHPQLGPIQTCDTCLVEINGTLARACGTKVSAGMEVLTESVSAQAAQREAFDRILGNHQLYCTVCDNNNGNCTVHNTTKLLQVEHQKTPFRSKPYAADFTNPFIGNNHCQDLKARRREPGNDGVRSRISDRISFLKCASEK